MSKTSIASRIASVGLAMVTALAFTAFAAPAEAGGRGYDRDWRGGKHHHHYNKHKRHGHHYRGNRGRTVHHHHYHRAPRRVVRHYAPPPVVYHAPRRYYAEPQVNIVLPLLPGLVTSFATTDEEVDRFLTVARAHQPPAK